MTGSKRGAPEDDGNVEQSFTMRTDARFREDIDVVKETIGAATRAETIRRCAHLVRLLLEVDPQQDHRVVVVDARGRKREIVV